MKFVAAAFARLSVPRGLWHYLIVRSELRAALETERERNRAFAAHREGMQDIAELMDHEGRKLWIRKHCPEDRRLGLSPLPGVIVELGSAPIAQIPLFKDSKLAGELSS